MTRRIWFSLLLLALVIGFVLRAGLYAHDYSLFLDECALALNTGTWDFRSFFHRLYYDQVAPLGFLVLQNSIALLLGKSEQALRLLPLVSGVATLVLFWWACRRFLGLPALVAAVWLMAVNHTLIAYSAQAKQYATEGLIAVLLLALCRPLFDETLTLRKFWWRALCAGLTVWFSLSAMFLLFGIGIALALQWLSGSRSRSLSRMLGLARSGR